MIHHSCLFYIVVACALTGAYSLTLPVTVAYERQTAIASEAHHEALTSQLLSAQESLNALTTLLEQQRSVTTAQTITKNDAPESQADKTEVPFYSQFADISDSNWQKIGCGIASLAMIIDHYGEVETVDSLLTRGIKSGAYISTAGWSHAGLIALSKTYGLDGQTVGLYEYSMDGAFDKLTEAVTEGPVMVSVHYTFEPTNPIPHLAVITGIDGDTVYYNDPAEKSGGGSLSAEKFKSAWKKRYIEIRPTS